MILAIALVAGLGLRVAGVAGKAKGGLDQDESVSYLVATCHLGDYARLVAAGEDPLGLWVPATEWKRFLRPSGKLCPDAISVDLARFDVHPPLYFWLLHGWVLIFGVSVVSGLLLNILLAVFAGAALFALTRRATGQALPGALATFVWAVSPAVVPFSLEARQYTLFTLVTVLFAWQALRVAEKPQAARARDYGLLAAATTAGALTHYHFAFVAMGVAVLLALYIGRERPRPLFVALTSIVAGYVAMAVLHPGFTGSMSRLSRWKTRASDDLSRRIFRAVDIFDDHRGLTTLDFFLAALFVGGAAWLIVCARRARRSEASTEATREMRAGAAAAFVFLWISGAVTLVFLSFRSPPWATGPKYLASAWPFAAVVGVLVLRRVPKFGTLAAVALGFILLVSTVTRMSQGFARPESLPGQGDLLRSVPALSHARQVVIASVHSSELPRTTWALQDRTQVYTAPEQHLERCNGWRDELNPGALLVGFKGRARSDRRLVSPTLRRLLASVQTGDLVPVELARGKKRIVYELRRRSAEKMAIRAGAGSRR